MTNRNPGTCLPWLSHTLWIGQHVVGWTKSARIAPPSCQGAATLVPGLCKPLVRLVQPSCQYDDTLMPRCWCHNSHARVVPPSCKGCATLLSVPSFCQGATTLVSGWCHPFCQRGATLVPECCYSCATLVPECCHPCARVLPPLSHPCATLVPEWCHSCAGVLPPLCQNGATLMPGWCHTRATLMSGWFYPRPSCQGGANLLEWLCNPGTRVCQCHPQAMVLPPLFQGCGTLIFSFRIALLSSRFIFTFLIFYLFDLCFVFFIPHFMQLITSK